VRENSETYNEGGWFAVGITEPLANWPVSDRTNNAPKNCRDQTVRIRVEIRVDHASRGETFDDPQLFNPQQYQRRPNVIEKLHSYEQNPERNSVSFRFRREGNTVVPNKHVLLQMFSDAACPP
jgi:hypothetical protein